MSGSVDANLAVDIGGKKRFVSAVYSPFGDTSLLVTQKGRGRFSGNKHRRSTVTNWLGGNNLAGGTARLPFDERILTPLSARVEASSGALTLHLQWDTTIEGYNLSKYTRDPLGSIYGDELFFLGDGDNGVPSGTYQSLGTYKAITETTVDGVRRVQYDMNTGIGGALLAGERIYVANFQPGGPYTISSGGSIDTPSSGYRKYTGVTVAGGTGSGGEASITFDTSTNLIVNLLTHTSFTAGRGYELGDSLTFSITGATPAYTGGGGRVISLSKYNLGLEGIAQQLVDLVPELNGKGVQAQKGFMLKTDHRNTPTIFIGGPTMRNLTGAQINQYPEGIPLGPADAFFIDVTELSQIYVIADSNPSGVYSYIYWMDM